MELKCAVCRVQSCREEPGVKPVPVFCPTATEPGMLAEARQVYADAETQRLARTAAQVEAEGYCRWPRVQEVMEFAYRLGVSHLGVATCVGLLYEAIRFKDSREAIGFEASGVCGMGAWPPRGNLGGGDGEKSLPGK